MVLINPENMTVGVDMIFTYANKVTNNKFGLVAYITIYAVFMFMLSKFDMKTNFAIVSFLMFFIALMFQGLGLLSMIHVIIAGIAMMIGIISIWWSD